MNKILSSIIMLIAVNGTSCIIQNDESMPDYEFEIASQTTSTCYWPTNPCYKKSCNDGNECTADACVINNVTCKAYCTSTPVAELTACTTRDSDVGKCVYGNCYRSCQSMADCHDNNGCTGDLCAPDEGICIYVNACGANETCNMNTLSCTSP